MKVTCPSHCAGRNPEGVTGKGESSTASPCPEPAGHPLVGATQAIPRPISCAVTLPSPSGTGPASANRYMHVRGAEEGLILVRRECQGKLSPSLSWAGCPHSPQIILKTSEQDGPVSCNIFNFSSLTLPLLLQQMMKIGSLSFGRCYLKINLRQVAGIRNLLCL